MGFCAPASIEPPFQHDAPALSLFKQDGTRTKQMMLVERDTSHGVAADAFSTRLTSSWNENVLPHLAGSFVRMPFAYDLKTRPGFSLKLCTTKRAIYEWK